jgi:hypothetical protein
MTTGLSLSTRHVGKACRQGVRSEVIESHSVQDRVLLVLLRYQQRRTTGSVKRRVAQALVAGSASSE